MKRNNSRPDALLLGLAAVQVADVLAEENLATDRRVASGDEHDLSGRVVLDDHIELLSRVPCDDECGFAD